MAGRVEARLAEMGIVLPKPAAPAAKYVPWVQAGGLIHVSGQLPMRDGKLEYTGTLGAGVEVPMGQAAARLCAIQLLAQAREAADGDLDRVRLVKLNAFVASAPGFGDQPKVANGASELMFDVLGEAGKHARSAVGVAALPFGAAVEIDAIFEIA